jgi:hypothetical protein
MGRLARERGKSRGSLIAAKTTDLQDCPGANTVEDEDSGSTELAEVLPDEAFALSAANSVRERSRDDENEDDFHRSHAEFWRTIL